MKESKKSPSLMDRIRSAVSRREQIERVAEEAVERYAKDPADSGGRSQRTVVEIHPAGVQPVLVTWGVSAWLLIGVVIAIWGIFHMAASVQWVLVAVFLGLVMTSLLHPIVNLLDRIMPRALATALALLGLFAALGGIIYWIIDSVANQWSSLSEQMQRGLDGIFNWIANGPIPINITVDELREGLNEGIERAATYLQNNAGNIASTALSQAGTVALAFTLIALALFCSIFFLAAGKNMWLWFINVLPDRARRRTHAAATAGWYSFSGYARGTILIALCDGVMAAILLVACGVPLAAPLATLVVIGAFIPLFGAPAAMIIAALVALATKGVVISLVVLVGVALIGQFEGHVLQPLIMGHQVSLHPVVIAVGVTAGTFVAGLLGAIIVIPLISIVWEVFKVLRRTPDKPLTELPELDLRDLAGTAVAKQLLEYNAKELNIRAEESPSPVTARAASHTLGGEERVVDNADINSPTPATPDPDYAFDQPNFEVDGEEPGPDYNPVKG
ncbi:AI-2E family transporter [Actinotignum sp. GS-2025g]|uniref:AI-2E family transporter n=1 Tax=Actinotignum TaxID=1653174 RepID=UPI00255095E7|nr:AI-2E family transporter [Actinotignum timonense]MDK6927558.1 AI-2E family transporter [Actinotignum timonense]